MKKVKKTALLLIACGLSLVAISPMVFSHCEIPCGIYGDPMRLDMMAEHITTIDKSMKQIQELSAEGDKNYNQIVRWIVNKEKHANNFSDIVTQYFMKQRLKPVEESDQKAYKEYIHRLTLLHKMMIYTMKCKQTTDLENIEKLRAYLSEFRKTYLGTGS